MEWKTIDSAPKDGMGVLVRDYYQHNGERLSDGRLSQTGKDGFGVVVARFDHTHGWHVAASVTNDKYILLSNPTHWMPLPPTPDPEV